MDKKPINEGLVRGNIKVVIAQDGVQRGIAKPPTQALKPPPPPASKK